MAGPQFYPGVAVYDADNQQVGTVQAYDDQTKVLVVAGGTFFHKDFSVPVDRVGHHDADGNVCLTLHTADLGADSHKADIVVPEYEEELVVGKRQEKTGDVHLRKDVVMEQKTVPVTLQHEEVQVERTAVAGKEIDPATIPNAFKSGDIDVSVRGEEAVVSKQVHETEEVRLHKEVVTENQQVTDTVRKEDVTISSDPAGLVSGDLEPRR